MLRWNTIDFVNHIKESRGWECLTSGHNAETTSRLYGVTIPCKAHMWRDGNIGVNKRPTDGEAQS